MDSDSQEAGGVTTKRKQEKQKKTSKTKKRWKKKKKKKKETKLEKQSKTKKTQEKKTYHLLHTTYHLPPRGSYTQSQKQTHRRTLWLIESKDLKASWVKIYEIFQCVNG